MAQANTQAAFDFAREVVEAKGPSDLVKAWTTNATKQFDTLTKQAGRNDYTVPKVR
jgi:Phasin protein